jgi:hypothetical protein
VLGDELHEFTGFFGVQGDDKGGAKLVFIEPASCSLVAR